ncbi:helix-turn-helix domain-containing protein [Streptomyces scopuliridis]|uniref:helix-turn-helix domain-containing protein n=1 Tax=Streptomyces scopuliridis TaxID=452529 RepID=UPI0035DE0032
MSFRKVKYVLFLRISSFIHEHLRDPELGPTAVATAHRISLRYLHLIFQQQGTTVSAFIKQQRLDHCRRELSDPGLHHLTIHAIGTRWGFTTPGDFSRAFRASMGMPPSEYRSITHQTAARIHLRAAEDLNSDCRSM